MKGSLANTLYPPTVSRNEGQVLKCLYSYLWLRKYLRIDVFGCLMFVRYYFYPGDRNEIYGASVLEPLYYKLLHPR